jgi:hypothetical protein
MTTRPGYVWDNTASEWVTIGPVALPGSNVSYQASAPTSPATGDIWVDSDDEVPGITSSLNYRWRKIATGGETSLSGNDTSGLPLAYNPGYEQVYLNGVLQYRGSDYVATTGNTITGLTALVAGDTAEVLSFVTAPIGDTYTQAAADAKFVSKTIGFNTVSATKTDAFSTTSVGSFVDVTGLSVTITPTSITSKFLVIANVTSGGSGNHNMFNIVRNGTSIAQPPTDTYSSTMGASINSTTDLITSSIAHLDSPATLSPITYKITARTSGATLFVNRRGDQASVSATSNITVIEIGA